MPTEMKNRPSSRPLNGVTSAAIWRSNGETREQSSRSMNAPSAGERPAFCASQAADQDGEDGQDRERLGTP